MPRTEPISNHRPSPKNRAIITFVTLTAIGISYLVHLDYRSTHQGELIRAWAADDYVMEQFQYGEFKNHTCLIKRTTSRKKTKTKTAARQKKIGTTRKIWLYKEGHCTDSRLRSYFRLVGSLSVLPFSILILLLCFEIWFPEKKIEPADGAPNTPMPIPQSEPPNDRAVSSNEGKVDGQVEMFENDKYQEEDAPPPV